MRILTRGTPPNNQIWRGTCIYCKSTAEALESELTNIVHDQREGSHSKEQCPVCWDISRGYMWFPQKTNNC